MARNAVLPVLLRGYFEKGEPELELPVLRDDARAQGRAVLDRCHEHLVARGFGVLELATLDLTDSESIGYQVAGELGIDYHEYIGESIYLWIQEARETRDLVERFSGYRAGSPVDEAGKTPSGGRDRSPWG